MALAEDKVAPRSSFLSRIAVYFATPRDEQSVEEHRRTVLWRTRAGALISAIVIPFTILVYFQLFRPSEIERAAWVSVCAELGVLVIVVSTRMQFFARFFHVPFFLLVGGVCAATEAVVLQLTGGGSQGNFLFPYFLVLFGIATLFPSRFLWGMAASAMMPISYVISEIWVRGEVPAGPARANLILLLDYAFMATIANRLTTRVFFREVAHRFALEVANRQLRELDRAKSDFFANVSHDLRSPLTVVLGPLSALAADKQNLQPRHLHYLQLALGGAAKLDSMINDLLELARIDAGVGTLRLGRVQLRELVGQLLESSTPYAQSLGLRFVFRKPEHPVPVQGDADKLERVLMNLLTNACKFSRADTVITVELLDLGERVQLSVKDQGAGIAPEDQAHIFGRFARGKDEGNRRTRGAGLGLAVVKEFVELHKGEVGLSSELGKGSCFTVILPKGEALPESSTAAEGPAMVRSRPPSQLLMSNAAASQARQVAPPGSPRVLIVEDTNEVRSFLEVELSQTFELHSSEDGNEALEKLDTVRPDVMVLDVMLPEVDGVEVCRRIRASAAWSSLPILMYSARGDLQTRLDAFAAGADDFLHKPFEPRELHARLSALIRRYRRDVAPPVSAEERGHAASK
jgi:signal transduction histidine kinase/ActR/RegA family two-component response regulator